MSLRKYWGTEAAAIDLSNIAEYTVQTWGADQLELYRKRLESRFSLLLKHPERVTVHGS